MRNWSINAFINVGIGLVFIRGYRQTHMHRKIEVFKRGWTPSWDDKGLNYCRLYLFESRNSFFYCNRNRPLISKSFFHPWLKTNDPWHRGQIYQDRENGGRDSEVEWRILDGKWWVSRIVRIGIQIENPSSSSILTFPTTKWCKGKRLCYNYEI